MTIAQVVEVVEKDGLPGARVEVIVTDAVAAALTGLHSADPAVRAAAEAVVGGIVGAAVRASGVGAPS